MVPVAEGLLWLVMSSRIGAVSAPTGTTAPAALRTFTVEKPMTPEATEPADLIRASRGTAAAPPPSSSQLRAVVGVGYVQHADWGAEGVVSGSIGRITVKAESLFTFGPQGPLFDHGTIWIQHADHRWFAEGGDLFSDLRGPATGARLSWQINDHWRPSLAVYGPPRHSLAKDTVIAYRERVEFGRVTLDGEIATDASHFFRGRVVAGGRFALESSYRRTFHTGSAKDAGVQAELRVWRGLAFTGGVFHSNRMGETNTWHSLGVRIPVHRSVGITFERTFTTTATARSAASAVMVDAHTNELMFLQRYEWGATQARQGGLLSMQRDQLHSMASFSTGPRLNLAMRVATQWQPTGPSQSWLEAQATLRPARTTMVQVTAPVSQAMDTDRVRVVLEQGLPRRFSVLAEYGRPSAYQSIQYGAEAPRFRLMLRRSFDVATPAGGGTVSGVVLDYIGRPVAGARVRLGSYSTDTSADGKYLFSHVPPGDHELMLDPDFLPADYAWDGRARRITVRSSSRSLQDLVVAPLNAIRGRVFADRDGNGRFTDGEGIVGVVVRLGDRVTATNADGAYDFYNVMPGSHVVELETSKLPSGFNAGDRTRVAVELRDDRPSNGIDFVVIATTKPVIWRTIK